MLSLPQNIPLQTLDAKQIRSAKIHLQLLRLDSIDFYTGGNKWFKLRYNLEEARKQGFKKILTFGGAWSNYLAAAAKVCANEFELIAVVRGEEPPVYSDTLLYCLKQGAKLHFVSRVAYRHKTEEAFLQELQTLYGACYILPEGASNAFAVKGCKEITALISDDFDFICTGVGSGGTLAGICCGLQPHQQALGFSALKGASFLDEHVAGLIEEASVLTSGKTTDFSAAFTMFHD